MSATQTPGSRKLSDAGLIACICLGTLVISLGVSELRPSCSVMDGRDERLRTSIRAYETSHWVPKLHSWLTSRQSDDYTEFARQQLEMFRLNFFTDVRSTIETKQADKLWPLIKPIVKCPVGRPLTTYGGRPTGDGEKRLCRLPSELHEGPCTIYSLGSNGDYSFEQAMLKETVCKVYTFDCTYDGRSQDPTRHVYHKWCVGDPNQRKGFRSWSNITMSLNHTKVDLLKMDIEGHEYSVFAQFKATDNLPVEMAVEIHNKGSPAYIAFAILHLAELGYALYSQEVNMLAPQGCCSEFSFMRFP